MAKVKTAFVCRECGHVSARWLGKCPSCNQWDSMVEEVDPRSVPTGRRGASLIKAEKPRALPDIEANESERVKIGIGELDRILGGGLVPGSAVLVGGDPGIGKSTLLLQAADRLAKQERKVLYVTGEESAYQIKLRAARLGCSAPEVFVVAETNLDLIREHVEDAKPDLVIVDSIQMIYDTGIQSAPGSVGQVRECSASLIHQAKSSSASIVLIGHVTKEGNIAGPRTLEHMVDTVLYFEGDKYHNFRILRAVKNRFGATSEIGIFEMGAGGLNEVLNPSQMLLEEYDNQRAGAVISPVLEGSRVLLVEVQALVAPSPMSSPRRRVSGIDMNRASMLMAVLERRVGLKLSSQEVYLNVVGGVTVDEPAVDLAACFAMASSIGEQRLPPATVFMGEVGLGGEVRSVNMLQARLDEAARLGFEQAVVPRARGRSKLAPPKGMKLIGVDDVALALKQFHLVGSA